jgi:hypothetical protein
MRTIMFTALAALAAPSAYAQETYSIKLKLDAEVGKSTTFRTSNKGSGAVRVFDPEGKQIMEIKKEGDERIYRSTILERDKNGAATRYIRVYEKATEKENGMIKTYSYQGRTVLFEKTDGKFRLGVAGEPPLDPRDVALLLRDANAKGDQILRNLAPNRPVKSGDSWSIPVEAALGGMDGFVVDMERSSVVGKLLRVYSKGKSLFGTFEVIAKVTLKELSEGGESITFEPSGSAEIKQKLDLAIDGSTTEVSKVETSSFKGQGTKMILGRKSRLAFEMKDEVSSEWSAEVNDPSARVVPKVSFAPDPAGWVEVKSNDEYFTIQFPNAPKKTTKKADEYTETKWLAGTDGGSVVYGLKLTEFAKRDLIDPAAILKDVVTSTKDARDVTEFKIGGLNGVEFRYDREHSGVEFEVMRRVIASKERVFELDFLRQKGKKAEPEKFFSSFKIVGKSKND